MSAPIAAERFDGHGTLRVDWYGSEQAFMLVTEGGETDVSDVLLALDGRVVRIVIEALA